MSKYSKGDFDKFREICDFDLLGASDDQLLPHMKMANFPAEPLITAITTKRIPSFSVPMEEVDLAALLKENISKTRKDALACALHNFLGIYGHFVLFFPSHPDETVLEEVEWICKAMDGGKITENIDQGSHGDLVPRDAFLGIIDWNSNISDEDRVKIGETCKQHNLMLFTETDLLPKFSETELQLAANLVVVSARYNLLRFPASIILCQHTLVLTYPNSHEIQRLPYRTTGFASSEEEVEWNINGIFGEKNTLEFRYVSYHGEQLKFRKILRRSRKHA